jgi:hypothetical protein
MKLHLCNYHSEDDFGDRVFFGGLLLITAEWVAIAVRLLALARS